MTRAQWSDPAFVAAASEWVRTTAADRGMVLTGAIEQPHIRPWSTVFRAPTDRGPVYLKACGVTQDHEPALSALLAREFPTLVPDLIARHPTEPWMLLGDAGVRLGDGSTGRERLEAWVRILPRYATMQRAMLGRERELIALGVPDRRPDRLAGLLGRVLDDDRVRTSDVAIQLRELMPTIEHASADLDALGIGTTLDHSDLHGNNVLLRDGREVILDWGDASVTHPFLTLAVTLDRNAERAWLVDDPRAIGELRDAYLRPWSAYASGSALEDACDRAMALGAIIDTLIWYAILTKLDGVAAEQPDELGLSLERARKAIARL